MFDYNNPALGLTKNTSIVGVHTVTVQSRSKATSFCINGITLNRLTRSKTKRLNGGHIDKTVNE